MKLISTAFVVKIENDMWKWGNLEGYKLTYSRAVGARIYLNSLPANFTVSSGSPLHLLKELIMVPFQVAWEINEQTDLSAIQL